MSTLCCAVLIEGGVAGNAEPLSPIRIAIPVDSVSGELSCEDSPVTTPEASTDSDDDSSFESYDDEGGALPISSSRRKAPACSLVNNGSWPGCVTTPTTNNNNNIDDKIIRGKTQPIPLRKVRFTLHNDHRHDRLCVVKHGPGVIGTSPSQGTQGHHRSWGKERRAAIQDSALQDVGMLARRQHHEHHQSPRGQKRISSINTSSTTTAENDRRRACKKRITAAAPFKSTSANVGTTNTTAHATGSASSSSSSSSIPAPVLTKKRKVSATSPSSCAASSMPHRRDDGNSAGGNGKVTRPRDLLVRPSPRGRTAAVPTAAALKAGEASANTNAARAAWKALTAAAALKTKEDNDASLTSSRALPLPRRRRRPEAAVDLSCKEELDVDALMKPKGEIRTPICRFLVPCWPEGVEGYEEQGGWRKLGSCHTRESFPRGRRSI